MEPETQDVRKWSVTETYTLLDLIQDMGLTKVLTRNSSYSWQVFVRLSVLLRRCNIHVSPEEVKSHWRTLKVKFFRLRRLLDMGTASGITIDFPFYEEISQLLAPRNKTRSRKREADSSGLQGQDFSPSAVSDHQVQVASSSNQEADERMTLIREDPLEGESD